MRMKRDNQFMSYEELYEAYQNCYDCMRVWENNFNDLKKKFTRLEQFNAELKQNISNGDVNRLVYLDKCQELENEIADLQEVVAAYQRNEKLDIRDNRRLRKNLLLTMASYANYKGNSMLGSVVSDTLKRAARKHRQAALFRRMAGEI